MVGAEAYGPSPAGDVELIDPPLLVISDPDPQFTFKVRGDIAELQQIFTGSLRGEHQPIFVIARVDRAKLGGVVEDSHSDLGSIVRLENIRAPPVELAIDRGANLLHAQAITAHIVIVVGFDSEFEVTDGRVDLQEEFAVAPSGDIELFGAFFLISPRLGPEFAFEINGNICKLQDISTGLSGYEHDPIFVSIGVYRVKLPLSGEDLHRQFALRVRFEFVNSAHLQDLDGLRLELLQGLVELGMECQIAVFTSGDQAHLPPSLGGHRQGDPFVVTVGFAAKIPGSLVALLAAEVEIAITVSTGSAYYKLPCTGRNIYSPDPSALRRPAETADRLPILNHGFARPRRRHADENTRQNYR